MNQDRPIAHVSEDGCIHLLDEHLRETAKLAERFAAEFGCGEWGRLAGLWHDLGKYSPEFQRYIRAASGLDAHLEGKPGRVDHSTAGGLHAVDRFNKLGRIFAYVIAGHHAGLPDWQGATAGMAALAQRLQNIKLLDTALSAAIPKEILEQHLPTERAKSGTELSRSLWLRMLFSCVVDADFLDTEAFFEPDKTKARGCYPTLTDLLPQFDEFMKGKQAEANATDVNRIRTKILDQCRSKACEAPGIYTLTVPTGGGKTLSSMAFALNHALIHSKRRIIYVIPYTSILEQAADQFRSIFGDAVIEHHSNLDVEDETRETSRSRLACENWDAPVIVTTTVQFFESLFASRTSRCRKLHNIVNSVVILDEAQLLPPDFLNPILEALDELRKNYGVTIVFCTATQPAFGPHKSMGYTFKGLTGMTEIMDDPTALYRTLKRTEISVVENLLEPQAWEGMATRLREQDSVLCIVNRRDDAHALWELMPEGTFHLSALMCGAHRSKKIAEIKQSLKDRLSTRVISTQLVEAGVDVDFPVVYRALAGLDSVAQAAGRCNREGLQDKGEVYVFAPPSKIPAGHLRQAAEIGRRLLTNAGEDPLSPEQFEAFFKEFYWVRGDRLDKENIVDLLRNDANLEIRFREAAKKFQLIDEAAQGQVIVRYRNDDLIKLLEKGQPERWLLRKLQRYVVNLPRYLHGRLAQSGAIREIHPGIFIQGHGALYHDDLGFCPDKSMLYEPDELMC
ncbi:MAG: CRISPR-associated endonuclease Cas3'' [Deltaproteobacteria bacterium]|nr:CRISPR-associated endonuclease Cas3'' [Deltaproteobacteria bacterium]